MHSKQLKRQAEGVIHVFHDDKVFKENGFSSSTPKKDNNFDEQMRIAMEWINSPFIFSSEEVNLYKRIIRAHKDSLLSPSKK